MTLNEQLLETVRSHRDTARAAYKSRDNEVALLKGRISVLEQEIALLHCENIGLRAELRRAGIQSLTDVPVVR
jgi:hypothetical protein